MQRVTDFTISTILMTHERFYSLPKSVQEYLRTFGTERPQGWGKPSIIEIPSYHLDRIEELARAEAQKRIEK